MQNRQHLATLKFTLPRATNQAIDLLHLVKVEMFLPAIIDCFCLNFDFTPTEFTLKFNYIDGHNIANVAITITGFAGNQDTSQIDSHIKKSMEIFREDDFISDFKYVEDIKLTIDPHPTDNLQVNGNLLKRTYSLDQTNNISEIKFTFINEYSRNLIAIPSSVHKEFDTAKGTICVDYQYLLHRSPSVDYYLSLENKAAEMIANTKHGAFLTSIKEGNFNQALRRACAIGNIELVQLLLGFNSKYQINLNVNDFTLSTKKTALDYANQSGNKNLCELLISQSAKTFDDLRKRFLFPDRALLMHEYTMHRLREYRKIAEKSRPDLVDFLKSLTDGSYDLGPEDFILPSNKAETQQKSRKPEELIHPCMIDVCLRNRYLFEDHACGTLTAQETESLRDYQKLKQDEFYRKNPTYSSPPTSVFENFGSHASTIPNAHVFGYFGRKVDTDAPSRKPEDMINLIFVEQCLRTGQPFEHYANSSLSSQDRESLREYERSKRIEFNRKQTMHSSQPTTFGSFGVRHQPNNQGFEPYGSKVNIHPPTRKPEDMIDYVFVQQCLQTGHPFEYFAKGTLTPQERDSLHEYEKIKREEYERNQANVTASYRSAGLHTFARSFSNPPSQYSHLSNSRRK